MSRRLIITVVALVVLVAGVLLVLLLSNDTSQDKPSQGRPPLTARSKSIIYGPSGAPAILARVKPNQQITLKQYQQYSLSQFDKKLILNQTPLISYDACLTSANENVKRLQQAPAGNDDRLRPKAKPPDKKEIAQLCKSLPAQARKNILGEMIYQLWLDMEVQRLDVKVSDADRDIVRGNMPKSQNSREAKEKMINQSAQQVAILRKLNLLPDSNPRSDKDYYAFYRQNRDLFTLEKGPRAWILTFPSKAEAESALAALRGGASWETVARRVPAEVNRSLGIDRQGGFPLNPRFMYPEIRQVVLGKRNQVRGPVKSRQGWIIGRNTMYAGTVQPYSQVKKQVRQMGVGLSIAKAQNKLFNILLAKYRPRTRCAEGWASPYCINFALSKKQRSPTS